MSRTVGAIPFLFLTFANRGVVNYRTLLFFFSCKQYIFFWVCGVVTGTGLFIYFLCWKKVSREADDLKMICLSER